MRFSLSHSVRNRVVLAHVVSCLLVLGACAGADDNAPVVADAPATGDSVVAPADDASSDPSSDGSIADLVVDEPAASGAGGFCSVTSTGAVELSYRSGGGASAVSSDYWLPEGVVSPLEPVALLINCDAGDGTLLSMSKVSVDELAFGPGSVVLDPIEVGLFTPDAIMSPAGPVTMQLDAFDAAHVAGSVSFEVRDGAGASSSVLVDFDLSNPAAG